jgi:hypothetical protein
MHIAKGTLTAIAVVMLYSAVSPKPVDALFPVAVDADVTATAIEVTQNAQMIQQITNQASQITNQIKQYQAQLLELQSVAKQINRPGSLQALTNQIIVNNNQHPTEVGTLLATTLVEAQNGSGVLLPGELSILQNEVAGAAGNLQAQGANVDSGVTTASAVKENTDLEAALEVQRAADLNVARFHRPQMLDTVSGVPFNGGDGGFTAKGIKDYGADSVL